MRKFPATFQHGIKPVKRSVTMAQLEVLWLVAQHCSIDKHRKWFNLQLAFPGTEFAKAITVKKIPNGYIKKFEV